MSPNLRAPVGTLMISVESEVRDARVEMNTGGEGEVDTTMVSLFAPEVAMVVGTWESSNSECSPTPPTRRGVRSVFGRVLVPQTLALANSTCLGSLSEIRKQDEDDRTILLDETTPKGAGVFAAGMSLCVAVDGETAIPKPGLTWRRRNTRVLTPPSSLRLVPRTISA